LTLDHGKADRYSDASPSGLAWARDRAADLRRRQNLSVIREADLARMRAEADRTTYLFDVRDPTEFIAGHRGDCRSAPGGQLVQATDYYVGVRNGRIVVTDDDGVRATMTASWLAQMGWNDVHILIDGLSGQELIAGASPGVLPPECPVPVITPHALAALKGALVIDLDSSLAFRDAHVPGAHWAIGPRFDRAVGRLPNFERLVLTSADGAIASLAAGDIAALVDKPVSVLEGGTNGWVAAGFATEAGSVRLLDETVDVWYRPYDSTSNVEEKMREYLTWEVDLTQQIERDGDARFKVLTA
jgi:rhodanese-related sulfurtransferase